MTWIVGITIGFLAFLLVEAAILRHARRGIPCRIVVTGTRGKSSLVRLLVAGIRATEPSTWGKITGDAPLLLLPDGMESVLARRGPARVHEQARLLITCRRQGVRCLVLESMTISPEAMLAEMRLVDPTLVVVTNVRDDHRETLGDDPDGQRTAYLAALPESCRWLTPDADLLAFAARSGRCRASLVGLTTAEQQDDRDRNSVASEMLATAEAVLTELGWNTESARQAMKAVAADLVPPPRKVPFLGHEVRLLDAFSANDLQSLAQLWAGWRRDLRDEQPWSVLLSTRADRPLRTRQFCHWLAGRPDVGTIHVAGNHRWTAARLLRQKGVAVRELNSDPMAAVAGTGAAGPGDQGVLVGMGNAQGVGLCLRAAACRTRA